jgi:hypothetical protein
MKIVGHRTESVYRRYAIADERMLREAATKLETLHTAEREMPPVVVAISEARRRNV